MPDLRLSVACVASVSAQACSELKVALVPTLSTNLRGNVSRRLQTIYMTCITKVVPAARTVQVCPPAEHLHPVLPNAAENPLR